LGVEVEGLKENSWKWKYRYYYFPGSDVQISTQKHPPSIERGRRKFV
jgi:hypothetical protein